MRTDLTWPYAVLGWAAERQGDVTGAVKHYLAGLGTLGTTSAFTETWGTGEPTLKEEFVVERLVELQTVLSPDVLKNDYLKATLESKHSADFFRRIRRHWFGLAEVAENEGRYADAYNHYHRAGWDILVLDEMESILDHLVRNANAAGWPALASIAKQHRRSLS